MHDWKALLAFWFGDLGDGTVIPPQRKLWYEGGPAVDEEIRNRFFSAWIAAAAGGLQEWETSPNSKLALIVLLDQFSRHLYRGKREAFAQDPRALSLAQAVLLKKEDLLATSLERVFLYLPFMHSEDLAMQKQSVTLGVRLVEEAPAALKDYFSNNLIYNKRHCEIIERFGRFPHRNQALGRISTDEEVAFLKEPMSSF